MLHLGQAFRMPLADNIFRIVQNLGVASQKKYFDSGTF